jgi:hypothetical protein
MPKEIRIMPKKPIPSACIKPADDPDVWRPVRNAPRAAAIDGTILVDLAFIFEALDDSLWWPMTDLAEGYLPLEATKLWL